MKTNQNGFSAVLAVLIVAVALIGAGAYFYATQTVKQKTLPPQTSMQVETSATASWHTYRNVEWGIEIQYPSNWNLKGNEIHDPNSSAYLGISRLENPKNLSFDEWWKDSTIVAGRATVLASSEDTIINGIKAKIAYMPEENGWHVHIADNQNHIYSLITEGKVADKQTFDKMLSTLKFIDSQKKSTANNANLTGIYQYGSDGSNSGSLYVLQTSDNEINFALDLLTVPALHMGTISSGVANLSGSRAVYKSNEFGDCELEITFDDKGATIKGVEGHSSDNGCGFGANVYADGVYLKTSNELLELPKFPK